MSESKSHIAAKKKAAGKGGETEVPLPGGRRLDARTADGKTATEIERSGKQDKLVKAVQRLKTSGSPEKVLQVPQKDMPTATKAMEKVGVSGKVKNMGDRKSITVKPKR